MCREGSRKGVFDNRVLSGPMCAFWNKSKSPDALRLAWARRRPRLLSFLRLFHADAFIMRKCTVQWHAACFSLCSTVIWVETSVCLPRSCNSCACWKTRSSRLICADASEGKWGSSLTGLEHILEVLSLCSEATVRTPELREIKDLYLHAGTLHPPGH